jgi:hypothetical protein
MAICGDNLQAIKWESSIVAMINSTGRSDKISLL